jgi:hypothetical protein
MPGAEHPAQRWADTWRWAWESLDVDAVVALYAPDATLSSQPFRAVHRGGEGVREYVNDAFAVEREVRVRMGAPLIDGMRAVVEWWATLREAGVETTLAGTSVLQFDGNGLVVAQRDTWNQAEGVQEPFEGWGT